MSKTLNKALDILDALSRAGHPVSLTELCQVLDMHPSTVYRLSKTLVDRDFVTRNPLTRTYSLGFKLLQMASAASYHTNIVETARPVLVALVKDVQESANLVVRHRDEAIYIDQVPCDAIVRAFTQVGARAPLHCTGVGKVLLAFSPAEDVQRYIEEVGLSAATIHTITNPYALREQLEEILAQGFALDNEEREVGTRCIAAPVKDSTGKVIAAISISSPGTRLPEDRWNRVADQVKGAARAISLRMGFPDAVSD